MKETAKKFVVSVLSWQVKRLRDKANFKIVGVAGSIGKTSTKFAIATVLQQQFRVQFQEGNYNDIVTVPLIFFGLPEPSLRNPFAWLVTFIKIEQQLRRPYPYDIVVVELSTDGPGQIAAFEQYIDLDIGVLTSITPEHMAFFKDLDAVAKEELSIAAYSKKLFVNKDLCDEKYLTLLKVPRFSYAVRQPAAYRLESLKFTPRGYNFAITFNEEPVLQTHHTSIAETQLYSICAAVAVGHQLDMDVVEMKKGIGAIQPVSGRMRHLRGINESLILDDTYNASPEATTAALDTLYKLPAKQKIAILGNMNELGVYGPAAHREVGNYCDPDKLDLVITIGPEANQYLAAAAEKKGCNVKRFDSPYKAGEYLQQEIKPKALILAKGSQNGVFAEEAVKLILADADDESKLVRQSKDWLNIKAQQFKP